MDENEDTPEDSAELSELLQVPEVEEGADEHPECPVEVEVKDTVMDEGELESVNKQRKALRLVGLALDCKRFAHNFIVVFNSTLFFMLNQVILNTNRNCK